MSADCRNRSTGIKVFARFLVWSGCLPYTRILLSETLRTISSKVIQDGVTFSLNVQSDILQSSLEFKFR